MPSVVRGKEFGVNTVARNWRALAARGKEFYRQLPLTTLGTGPRTGSKESAHFLLALFSYVPACRVAGATPGVARVGPAALSL